MNTLRSIASSSLGILLFGAVLSPAQESPSLTNAPTAEGRRYLIVLDTSRSMKSRMPGATDLVEHLIATGMDGRMQRGDTIGLWTFGNGLRTGAFPLQKWAPERRGQIAAAMSHYIESTPVSGSTELRKPVQAALGLVKESDAITILFITDGEELFQGTPFDAEINSAIKRAARPMQSSRLPFAVFWVGHGGKLTTYAVNSSFKALAYPEEEMTRIEPAPVTAPLPKEPAPGVVPQTTETKPEPKPSETAAAASSETTIKQPQPQPVQNETPAVAPPTAQPEVVIPAGDQTRTTEKGSVILPQPVVNTAGETSQPTASGATKPETTAQPTQATVETPSTQATSAPETKPAKTEPQAEVATTAPAATPIATPATASTAVENSTATGKTPQATVIETPATATEATAPPGPAAIAKPAEVAALPLQAVPAPNSALPEPPISASPGIVATPSARPTIVSTQTVESITLQASPVTQIAATNAIAAQTEAAITPTNIPAPILAAIPPAAGYSSHALLLAAFALLTVAAGLILLMLKRRVPAGASIITRSMDHDKL